MNRFSTTAHLLVVDDDVFTRRIYSEILKGIQKVEIHELESAENAVEYIKTHKPDIVIMDYKLPGMDGLEATKQIVMAHPDTIVIVISGDASESLEENMLEIGAVSFFKKPVRGKLLYFTVLNFIEIVLSKKELEEQIDMAALDLAKEKATESCSAKKAVTSERSSTFIDSFDSEAVDERVDKLINIENKKISAEEFFDFNSFSDNEIDDFFELFDQLKYSVDSLGTVVEASFLDEISSLIKSNAEKLKEFHQFPSIVYSLETISGFMDSHNLTDMSDIPMKKLAVFIGDFFQMYEVWVKGVFINKDAEDVHFMDVTLLSFGLQMESIFSDMSVLSEDDEKAVDEGGSVEFF